MKDYFLYILKKRIPIIIALTIIFLIAVVIINNVSPYTVMEYKDGIFYEIPRKGLFNVFIVGIIVLSIIVSLIEFSFKMIRIQAQQAYSFPILRKSLFLARYLVGLIEIIIPLLISFCVSATMVSTSTNMYDIKMLWLFLPCAILMALFCFSYLSFIYCRGNNIIDGIAGMALSIAAPLSFGFAIETFLNHFGIEIIFAYYFTPFYVLEYPTKLIETLMVKEEFISYWIPLVLFIFWIIISSLAIGFMGYFNQRIKSEDIMSDSNSLFIYRIFIGLATISLTISLSFVIGLWAPIIGIGLTFLGYVLYKRGINFDDKNMCALWISLSNLFIGILLVSLQFGGVL